MQGKENVDGWIPLESWIASDTVAMVVAESVVPIACFRLVVPQDYAPNFTIEDVQVGRKTFTFGNLGSSGIAASYFSDAPCKTCSDERLRMLFPGFPAGVPIVINVRNISGRAAMFRGALEVTEGQPYKGTFKQAVESFYDTRRHLLADPIEIAEHILGLAGPIHEAIEALEDKEASWPDTARKVANLLRRVIRR